LAVLDTPYMASAGIGKFARRQTALGRECVKTLSRTLAMIFEDFIAGIAHEALYAR
jgi:hypothetical protein